VILEKLTTECYGVLELLRIAVAKMVFEALREFASRTALFAFTSVLFFIALDLLRYLLISATGYPAPIEGSFLRNVRHTRLYSWEDKGYATFLYGQSRMRDFFRRSNL